MKIYLLLNKNCKIFILFLILIFNSKLAYSQRLIRIGKEEMKNKNYIQAIETLSDAIKKYPKVQLGYYFYQ